MDKGWAVSGGVGFRSPMPNDQSVSYSMYGANYTEGNGWSFARGATYTNGGGRVSYGASDGTFSKIITLGINLGPVFSAGAVVDPLRIPKNLGF